jgi:hypothetical protein
MKLQPDKLWRLWFWPICRTSISLAAYLYLLFALAHWIDSDEWFLFSSAVSPDGTWIAENFGTGGCCNGGFVVVRKISERSSNAAIVLPSPAADLFMIWRDDTNLSLFQNAYDGPFNGPSTYRGVNIAYSTYSLGVNDHHTFDAANVSKKSLAVKEKDVSVETSERQTTSGRMCVLSLSIRDGVVYDKVGVRIEASVNRCDRDRLCVGISSNFWVGERVDRRLAVALTSATISSIPSYNRTPVGDRMGAVRGGFYGNNAVQLMAAFDSRSIDIQYSLNFFDEIVSYTIPTNEISESLDFLIPCVRAADFN